MEVSRQVRTGSKAPTMSANGGNSKVVRLFYQNSAICNKPTQNVLDFPIHSKLYYLSPEVTISGLIG
jgi:hypothetical protein